MVGLPGAGTGWTRRSRRSAPEQKTGPAPVRTTTRTSGSDPAATRAAVSWLTMAAESALRFFGESMVKVTTPPGRVSRRTGPAGAGSPAPLVPSVPTAGSVGAPRWAGQWAEWAGREEGGGQIGPGRRKGPGASVRG